MGTTLADLPDEENRPVHQLLIGDTKLGKSSYIAQAAIDGFPVLYIDSDNGLSALRMMLRGNVEAKSRVVHIPTAKPVDLLTALVEERREFRWNITKDSKYIPATASPTDMIFRITFEALVKTTDLILGVDSWTSTAAHAMAISAAKCGVELTDLGNSMQAVYGGANRSLTYLLEVFQHAPFNVVVIAHGGRYEIYDKPLGKSQRDAKQHEFILREVLRIPISSSNPHGVAMGKYFDHIAWLEVDNIGRVNIDYTRSSGKVGGGPPNARVPLSDLQFKDLMRSPPNEESFHRYVASGDIAIIPATEILPAQPAKLAPATSKGNEPNAMALKLAGLMQAKATNEKAK